MKAYLYPAAAIAFAIFAAACGNEVLLGQTAAVTGFFETNTDPCRWQIGSQPAEEWPVKEGSKFKIEVRKDSRYYIDVKEDGNNPLEKADMFVPDPKATALATDYCEAGGPVRNHLYALGITEFEHTHDPLDTMKLRALIYFPMRLKAQTPAGKADMFYLILLRVADEAAQCDDEHGAAKPRCLALQRLGVLYRQQATTAQFTKAIKDEIGNILPDNPERIIVFHNGVIHGIF